MSAFLSLAAFMVIYLLYQDGQIRGEIYTEPLKQMPENIRQLSAQMLAAACEGKNLTPDQTKSIAVDIARMMSEGAVAQRNFEMDKTRAAISRLGLFLSQYMKEEGMTYAQLQQKYEAEFSKDELAGHQQIIASASRVNPNLLYKYVQTLRKKFGLTMAKL
jgi:methylphosphotriester-DNA--protein-cysteine methyltransferase